MVRNEMLAEREDVLAAIAWHIINVVREEDMGAAEDLFGDLPDAGEIQEDDEDGVC